MLNKQGEGKIDWCDFSWNPISGCLHNCEYCYLKRMHGFDITPKFHQERLRDLDKIKEPSRIFTGSSGDMLGDWLKHEDIQVVIDVMTAHPQHTFQILTKNPKRYLDFHFPKNVWLGTSVDGKRNIENLSWLRQKMDNLLFVSFEPLLERLEPQLGGISWVIIGGKSGRPPFYPPYDWVNIIIQNALELSIPIFIKDNTNYSYACYKEFPKAREN